MPFEPRAFTPTISARCSRNFQLTPIFLNVGDVLIRHPWVLHRSTPNTTYVPRPLASLRYVRRWYADTSRETNEIALNVWESMNPEQRSMMRFDLERLG
jgi:hypothetical protein